MSLCISFIQNHQKLKTTQISNWQIDKQTQLYPYNGALLNNILILNKKEWNTDTHNKRDESEVHYTKCQLYVDDMWTQLPVDDILENVKL